MSGKEKQKFGLFFFFFGGGVLKSDNFGLEFTRRDERVTYK